MSKDLVHPEQRVGVFVDVQNIYHSAKHLYGARINFEGLMRATVVGRPMIRAVAYVVRSETSSVGSAVQPSSQNSSNQVSGESSGEELFFEALRKNGFELRMKDLQVYSDGMKKADWDVGMAVDAIRMANFLDVVILVTGDGDFVPLVEYLKWGMGRQVEVAAFSKTTSSKLRESADRFITLDEIPRILLRKRTNR